MLVTLDAVRFDKKMDVGKTKPLIVTCTTPAGDEIEVVLKLSTLMERKVVGLISEAIAGMLAEDLGLPNPTPFLVTLQPSFIDSVQNAEVRTTLQASSKITFASRRLPNGYFLVLPSHPIPPDLLTSAVEIFAFDALIQNSDRLVKNPNCQSNGSQFAIFDHELAFLFNILGWRPPWIKGSLSSLKSGVPHLFYASLVGKQHDLTRLLAALKALPEDRCDEYIASLPAQWRGDAKGIVDYIRQLKKHADAAIGEVLRVLR